MVVHLMVSAANQRSEAAPRRGTAEGTGGGAGIHAAAEDVRVLVLADPDGHRLPAWSPGAHVDVLLPSGLIRQYSLCGDPADVRRWQIAVLRVADGRGGSAEMHGLELGARLGIRGPRNHFGLVPADRYLFIAGGIGITPIVPMVHEVLRRGLDWQLVY